MMNAAERMIITSTARVTESAFLRDTVLSLYRCDGAPSSHSRVDVIPTLTPFFDQSLRTACRQDVSPMT